MSGEISINDRPRGRRSWLIHTSHFQRPVSLLSSVFFRVRSCTGHFYLARYWIHWPWIRGHRLSCSEGRVISSVDIWAEYNPETAFYGVETNFLVVSWAKIGTLAVTSCPYGASIFRDQTFEEEKAKKSEFCKESTTVSFSFPIKLSRSNLNPWKLKLRPSIEFSWIIRVDSICRWRKSIFIEFVTKKGRSRSKWVQLRTLSLSVICS